jgi:hypothetical protein
VEIALIGVKGHEVMKINIRNKKGNKSLVLLEKLRSCAKYCIRIMTSSFKHEQLEKQIFTNDEHFRKHENEFQQIFTVLKQILSQKAAARKITGFKLNNSL